MSVDSKRKAADLLENLLLAIPFANGLFATLKITWVCLRHVWYCHRRHTRDGIDGSAFNPRPAFGRRFMHDVQYTILSFFNCEVVTD